MLDRLHSLLFAPPSGPKANRKKKKEAARAKDEILEEPGIDKARISATKDLLFIAFHMYLIGQFYLIYGWNIAIWDGVQLILSSILVVGDPLFHSMQPSRSRNNWEDNLESIVYLTMLIITSTRAILYPKNGSLSNLLASVCWLINKILPSPDNILKIRNLNANKKLHKIVSLLTKQMTLFSIAVLTSLCRGLYLAYLCSLLPLVNVQQDSILFSTRPCWFHFLVSSISMTTWSFLVIFVQHRTLICNEAKASGIWQKSIEPSTITSAASSPNSSQSLTSIETAWTPNTVYKFGQVVYVENKRNNHRNVYYKLVSFNDSNSKICPLDKNIIQVLVDDFLMEETIIEYSTVYRFLMVMLSSICILEAFLAFVSPKGFSFLLTSLVDLVIVFHLSDYFFTRRFNTKDLIENSHDQRLSTKNGEENCCGFNCNSIIENDSVYRKSSTSFSSSSNKKANHPRKKK